MSPAGLWLREEPLYKCTLGAGDLGHEPSPLQTQRLKSQHHENLSSISTTPALSVSCTPPLPPYFSYHVLGPWRPCFYGSFGSTPSSLHSHFTTLLSAWTVGNTLSPTLLMAGTTFCSRRKPFNRLRSISPLSSPPLEAA